jgi:peptide/nickel transport system ATP-binding protein
MSTVAAVDKAPESLVQIQDLRVHFPITKGAILQRRVGWVRAVDGVTLEILRGETLGLVGESGSGKTTLGRSLVRLIKPTSGSIRFRGVDLARIKGARAKRLASDLQMVFQDPYSSFDPRMAIGSSIEEPLRAHRSGRPAERRAAVADLLATVGLPRRAAGRYPHELSGGQRQRAGIARALALRPALIVADEPVSALDVSIQAQILNLLQKLQAQFQLTYLFIAHDLAVVRYISDRVAVMYLGEVVELASTHELYANPLHPYTIALLSAIPISDAAVEAARARIVLRGDPPSPANPPAGCRFHTRCWLRQQLNNPERCATEVPGLVSAGEQHRVACHFADEAAASPMRKAVLAYAADAMQNPPQKED